MKRSSLLLALTFSVLVHGQTAIQSGPMVGYSEMTEVALWVQTTGAAKVQFGYTEVGGDHEYRTQTVHTDPKYAFVAKLICDSVSQGKLYTYRVFIDGELVELERKLEFQTQKLWQWREDPPPFTFAIGSCNYVNEEEVDRPGRPYGSDHQIFETLNEADPDFMIWMGDNTYLREVDWFSRTGILHRNTHTRSLPELQNFLGHVHHYATWDDHDYGPNNSDRSFRDKEVTKEVFDLFWANPSSGLNGQGVTTMFQWADMDFFMLDNRWFRNGNRRYDLDSAERIVFDEDQMQWLFDQLSSSYAPYKFVVMGGQFLNTHDRYETMMELSPTERQRIIDFIYAMDMEGVIFLTGDRHHSEVSVLEAEGKPRIYDVTISPLTAGTVPDSAIDEPNDLVIDGTWVNKHCFGLFEVDGPRRERKLLLRVIDADGKELYNFDLSRPD